MPLHDGFAAKIKEEQAVYPAVKRKTQPVFILFH